MKKQFSISLIAMIVIGMFGCGGDQASPTGLLPPQAIQITQEASTLHVQWANPAYAQDYMVVLEAKWSTDVEFQQKSTLLSSVSFYDLTLGGIIGSKKTFVVRMKSVAADSVSGYSDEVSIEVSPNIIAVPVPDNGNAQE